ncbi:hypothetical protein HEL17_023440 [Escherichia sp. 14.0985]|nr:hypothetical protein [Escherichia sp. 14.0985]
MKKTLIALAVAASAAVSGSAMAWTASGTGGSVDLGGTLTPVEKVTPWEVKVGDGVTNLDADVQKGQKEIRISVAKAIPVLGIRNANANGFNGGAGIHPQIDYNGAIDLNGFRDGTTTLTLEVTGAGGQKLGALSAPFSSAAVSSWNGSKPGSMAVISTAPGESFYGGLGKNGSAIRQNASLELIGALSSDFVAKWVQQGTRWYSSAAASFDDPNTLYYAAYGSGIESGKNITITLKEGASGNAPIRWNASLPIAVTYQ